MDQRPVGWYRDPDDTRAHRYWDGQAWVVVRAVAQAGARTVVQPEVTEAAEVLQQQ